MNSKFHLLPSLTLILTAVGIQPLMAQNEKEKLKLNQEAVKMIQFDFTPHDSHEKLNDMLEAPLDKRWMKFKEDLSMPRNLTDSAKVKKPQDYIRAEPYTIWTAFGEDPVYDVLPGKDKKWEIHWKLDPYSNYKTEYGHELVPVVGGDDPRNRHTAGAVVTLDIDKFLFENFTKRGRMLRRNRKHANAWKTYAQYTPTAADSAKFPSYRLKPQPMTAFTVSDTLHLHPDSIHQQADSLHLRTDSIVRSVSTPQVPHTPQDRDASPTAPQKTTTSAPSESSYARYIRQRAAQDSIRRQEFLRRDKARNNSYDLDRQIRHLQERR